MKPALILCTATLMAASTLAAPPASAPTSAPASAPAPAPAAAPANRAAVLNGIAQPANNILDNQLRSALDQRRMYEGLPITSACTLENLVKISLADGVLRAEMVPMDLPEGQSRIKVEGSSSLWLVRSTANAAFPMGRYLNLSQFDFDQIAPDGRPWHRFLNCSDSYLTLNALGVGYTLTYHQYEGNVILSGMRFENGRYRQFLRAQSTSLLRLQAEHPEEVRQYLEPLLRRWTAEDLLRPGATDVYGTFQDLAPSGDATARLAALLPMMDSDLFADRDNASKELAKLGHPGIQAALRLDRRLLSFEQAERIDAALDRQRHRTLDDPKAARSDINFLLDCLEDDDPAVRASAKRDLEKLLRHPVAFDPACSPADRTTAADALRKALRDARDPTPATPATTQPAAPNN